MLDFIFALRALYDKQKEVWTPEFAKGFQAAYLLIVDIFEKSTRYNLEYRIRELENKIDDINKKDGKIFFEERIKYDSLKKKYDNLVAGQTDDVITTLESQVKGLRSNLSALQKRLNEANGDVDASQTRLIKEAGKTIEFLQKENDKLKQQLECKSN